MNLRKAGQLDPTSGFLMWHLAEAYMAMGDWGAVAEVRDQIGERLGHETVTWFLAEMNIKLAQEGWRESLMLDSIPGEMDIRGDTAPIHTQRALAYLVGADYQSALEQFLTYDGGWADPEQWQRLIRSDRLFGGCVVAAMFQRVGDEVLGGQLMQQALEYELQTLPGQPEATDRFSLYVPGLCHLVSGAHDEALEFFERQIALGRYWDWDWINRLPWWNPLRDDPRFIALEEMVEAKTAEQRELLRQMDEAAKQP